MRSLESYILEGNKFIVFVMCGVPGSGKSTWAKTNYPELPIVSRDMIRAKLGYTSSVDEKVILTNSQENEVTEEEYYQISKYAKKKQSFIVDDANSFPRYRKRLVETLRNYGARVIGVNINTPVELCIKRRNGQIPEEAIRKIAIRRSPFKEEDVDELINVDGY